MVDDGSMVRLRDIESSLPPGFRFHPSDEELVCYYLHGKVAAIGRGNQQQLITMVEVDLHVREPWDLPEAAKLGDKEWYFFSCRDRKYATGSRTNRATKHGYWKATGKDKVIHGGGGGHGNNGMTTIIGMRKTLVFYFGRAPNGRKSDWVMHEFRLVRSTTTSASAAEPMEDWVMCRVFHKDKGKGEGGGIVSSNHLIDVDVTTSPPPTAAVATMADIDNLGGPLLPISVSSSPTIGYHHHLLVVGDDIDHHALITGLGPQQEDDGLLDRVLGMATGC